MFDTPSTQGVIARARSTATDRSTAGITLSGAIRSALSPPGHHEYVVSGRLVLPENDRPIRSIITGRRVQTTGSYASRKAGRSQVFESMTERAFFMHCEVDTHVVDYRAQPFRFEFHLDGQWRTYIADCVRLLGSGQVEVVELKSDLRDLKDIDYQAKLERVRSLCRQLGWRFTVVRRRHLERNLTVHRNIEFVQQDRLTDFDDLDIYRVTGALKEGARPFDEVTNVLGRGVTGAAIVRAMMVARIVDIDLRRPLSGESSVRLLQSKEM
ncbi:TnsA endonuclease N-terminal domain-containing protein [Brevundimonas sp. SL130]|uniref:TnsA endonuclease N-terminal domain-containing protein n=1 Tax=Brevundimonas sp. SL130 TaxID=2995143 RepID=UPI00226D22E8|nr:TnsA endonuclease N-terminal domain-containing protein [Brevundimonas sp. SL130]WAC59789.1 hypothetical protein OU998_16530 [Brevundimonas sp. SL130]